MLGIDAHYVSNSLGEDDATASMWNCIMQSLLHFLIINLWSVLNKFGAFLF